MSCQFFARLEDYTAASCTKRALTSCLAADFPHQAKELFLKGFRTDAERDMVTGFGGFRGLEYLLLYRWQVLRQLWILTVGVWAS